MTTRENDTKEILEEIANLYCYDLTISKDGKVVFDGGSWKREFDSMNQAIKYWLPNFETAEPGVFAEEIKFINKCMMEDYLELFNDGRFSSLYIQKDSHHFIFWDGLKDIPFYIENGRIYCSKMDCIENAKLAFGNDPEMLAKIAHFENDWYSGYNKQKKRPEQEKNEDSIHSTKEIEKSSTKNTYQITVSTENYDYINIDLTDTEYDTVQRVFQEINKNANCQIKIAPYEFEMERD